MIAQMRLGDIFSIKYITYDRQRKTGGELNSFDECQLLDKAKVDALNGRALTHLEELRIRVDNEDKRDPNHDKWGTLNIIILQDGQPTSMIRKIHPLLVTQFNEHKVTL